MLAPRGVRIGLLTGSQKASEKKAVKRLCESGEVDIVIGTHAIIQEDVVFKNLGAGGDRRTAPVLVSNREML